MKFFHKELDTHQIFQAFLGCLRNELIISSYLHHALINQYFKNHPFNAGYYCLSAHQPRKGQKEGKEVCEFWLGKFQGDSCQQLTITCILVSLLPPIGKQ